LSKELCALRHWARSGKPPEAPADGDAGEAFLHEALRQGVTGLLARDVVGGVGGAWPAHLQDDLRSRCRQLVVRGQRQIELMGEVSGRLSRRGVRSLALKGAAVVDWLYDSPAERPMADVDLLVLGDLEAASGALRTDGYRLVERGDHAHALRQPGTGLVVELHRSVTSCPGLFPLDAERLWSRREAGPAGAARPGAADLLVTLALHAAFQHGLVLSLVQWLDVRRLLERAEVPAGELAAAAAGAGAEDAVAVTLHAAEAAAGARLPPALAERFQPRRRSLARWTAAVAADPSRVLTPHVPRLARARMALTRGRRARLVLLSLRGAPAEAGAGLGARALRAARLLGRAGLEWARP
jgi:hypothetical protein